MRAPRIITGCDQWARASHDSTAIDATTGTVGLSWTVPEMGDPVTAPDDATARGLAFDRFCRAYRPSSDNVWRTLLGSTRNGIDYATVPPATPVFAASALQDPVAVGVDEDDRLFVAEREADRVVIVDLWSKRVLRKVLVRQPLDLALDGNTVWVIANEATPLLLRFDARRDPLAVPMPVPSTPLPAGSTPARLTTLNGSPVVLFRDSDGNGWLVIDGLEPREVGAATDLCIDSTGAIVVAPYAGMRTLTRFVPLGDHLEPAEPLDARGYDGGGIAQTSEARIAYTTAEGIRLAVNGRLRYTTEGRIVSYRLDSGRYGARWGRIFLEANIPTGTQIHYALVTSDDDDIIEIEREPASPEGCLPYRPETSSPMPPPRLDVPTELVTGVLHERADNPEPWWRLAADDCFTTLEAMTSAPPGRYAWLTIRLSGNSRATPRVREIRVESQAHDLMRRLPRLYSTDPTQESFLQRYLALFDGMLHDLDQRALARDLLVDPYSTPREALSWLAAFVGMVLDERWPVDARRQLVAEAGALYRYRGTIRALSRYLELYLRVAPIIVEHHRLRGLGGPVVDDETTRSVLGYGMRVGGDAHGATGFDTHAHRFSVMIPRLLDQTEEQVVRHVLETERPAHTAYDLCTVDAGMRVNRSIHLGLSSVVGRTGGFQPAVMGEAMLGRDNVLGHTPRGSAVDAARIGEARIG